MIGAKSASVNVLTNMMSASDQSNDFGMFKVIRKAMDVTEELSIVSGYENGCIAGKSVESEAYQRLSGLSQKIKFFLFFFGWNCIEVRPS